MKKNKKKKKVKTLDSTCKTNIFFGTLPLSSWAMLATWLRLGVAQELQVN
jgi:hypothetical protein